MSYRLRRGYRAHPLLRGIPAEILIILALLLLAPAASRAAAPPAVSIDDVQVYETDAGTKKMRFTVTAKGAICGPITVGYRTQPGTAAAGSDFAPSEGTLALQLGPPGYVRDFGAGIITATTRIARAEDGDFYVLDKNNFRIVRFTPGGVEAGIIPLPYALFPFAYVDIAAGSGLVYVTEYVNNWIYAFDQSSGALVHSWKQPDTNGSDYDFGPFGIAVAPNGDVYATQYQKVNRYSASGAFIDSWYAGGFYSFWPEIGSDGKVFVGVSSPYPPPGMIQVFTADGAPVTTWSGASTAGIPYHSNITADGCGNVWTIEERRIIVAREDGTFLFEWPGSHPGFARLHVPYGLVFDDQGFVYFTDNNPGRIVQFEKRAQAVVEVDILGETANEGDESFRVELFDPVNAVLADASAQGTIANDDPQFEPNRAPNPSFDTAPIDWSSYQGSAIEHAAEGHDAPGAAQVTGPGVAGTFGINDSEDFVSGTPEAGVRYRFSGWVRAVAGSGSFRMRVREYHQGALQKVTQTGDVPFDAAWQWLELPVTALTAGAHLDVQVLADATTAGAQFLLDDFAIEPIAGDRAPIVEVRPEATLDWLHEGSFIVTARDPDGDPITGLTLDESSLPAGNSAHFTAAADGKSGVFTWAPNLIDVREDSYAVRFTAHNALSGSAATQVVVSPSVAVNGTFEEGLGGWNAIQDATLSRRPPGRVGGHSMVVTAPGDVGFCGVTDSPDNIRLTRGREIVQASAWLRSPNSNGIAYLRLRVYHDDVFFQQYESYFIELTPEWRQYNVGGSIDRVGSTVDLVIEFDPHAAGEEMEVDDVRIEVQGAGGLVAAPDAPSPVSLAASVAPNPVRRHGALSLTLPRAGALRVALYDVTGRRVALLADEAHAEAGTRTFALRGAARSELPAGIYFYRAEAAGAAAHGRFVVLE